MYSVIVPVYNGEKTVSKLFKKTNDFFEKIKSDFEMIFVHDCGPDNSWEELKIIKNLCPEKVTIVKMSRNFGQHNAIICGIEYAAGDFIITMDEDLQHNPLDIQKLIDKQLENDFDVVYGKSILYKINK